MEFQYETVTPVSSEPVSLATVKSFLRIDADYSGDDTALNSLITASREMLEREFNIGFGARTLRVRWNGSPLDLPLGTTGLITSVTKVSDNTPVTTDDYHVEGLNFKRIHVGCVGFTNVDWFYPINQGIPQIWSGWPYETEQYDVVYVTGYVSPPQAMLNALLVQIDYAYKLQGNESLQPISPQAKQLLSVYSRNLTIQ